MASFTIYVDPSSVTSKLSPDKWGQAKEQGMKYVSEELIRVLERNSPVDHGVLKKWFSEALGSDEAVIKSPAEYAQWVNDGTQPYTITPTSKKALYWEGADHPVKVVHHPGIRGRHFVEDSLNDVNGRLDGYFLKAISEVMG